VGSAGMGLWLTTQESGYWNGQKISSDQITVIGNKEGPPTDIGIPYISLEQLRKKGAAQAVIAALADIPQERHILVHLDVDVLSRNAMPAAYSPREPGLSLHELEQILKIILADDRVKFLELTEFIPSKDPGGKFACAIIDAIAGALRA
jgi:arginase family enzyme